MYIKWAVNGNGTYTLSYSYWQDGTQRDIPEEAKVTNSKTYTEAEVKAMFGGEGKAWFGVYAGADPKTEKWESIKISNDALRNLEINYYYPKKILDMETGTYSSIPEITRIPDTLIPSASHVGFNGKRLHKLPDLPSVMESYMVPIEDTATPLTLLKEPTLYTDGTNYLNPPTFTKLDSQTKEAEFYIVPFKKGAIAAERDVVHYYNIGVQPKTVDIKIEYVLTDTNGPIVADTVTKSVEIGSEVGAEAKTYTGYNLNSANDGATFDDTKAIVAKKTVDFNAIRANKAVETKTGTPALPSKYTILSILLIRHY